MSAVDSNPSPGAAQRADMVWVPGGTFAMGSDDFYAEEGPVHDVTVDGFWIDDHPVTVAEFQHFVGATGHVTMAERPPDPVLYPDAAPEDLVPGSLVFVATEGPVPLEDHTRWWAWVPGACWRHPEGPGSTVSGRADHPVTHVMPDDADAYAAWAGKALPTEAEWERAARGGVAGTTYAWGDEATLGGRIMANTWQGRFPWENLGLDGFERTSPVRTYPANGYGLFDMIGNVWEWTADPWTSTHTAEGGSCCGPRHEPAGLPVIATRVIKGGSHLCAPSYCLRYRPAARQSEAVDTSTSHIGFRCVLRPDATTMRDGASGAEKQ